MTCHPPRLTHALDYIDVIEASEILDIHPETVKRLIREGKLTATKSATSGS